MKNADISKRVNRILKYSNNAEQTALDTLKDSIGFDIAIKTNPNGVLKLLKACVKKEDTYINIWDLQFMVEDGKLELPEEYKEEYKEAIQELSSRLRFVQDEDDEAECDASNLFAEIANEYESLEEFNDRDIISHNPNEPDNDDT